MPTKILDIDGLNGISDIKDILRRYDVITAGDGSDAISRIKENADIDLIVFHLYRSKPEGFQLLKKMNGSIKRRSCRIVVLSDSGAAEDEVRCFNLGACEYIREPADVQVLKHRLNRQLEIVRKEKISKNLKFTIESIFRQSPIGISISHNSSPSGNGEETLVDVNARYEQILGRKKDELLSLGWASITHPDDLEEDLKMFRRLQSGEISEYSADKRFIKPDGSIIWAHMVVGALDLQNSNKYNHICLLQDITEQKAVLSKLEESRELFRTFFDSSRDPVFLKDENFRYLFANRALTDFYKVGADMLAGKSDCDFFDSEVADACRRTDREVADKHATVNAIETINGRILEIRKFPVRIGEGKTGVGAYIRDITEQYMQQEIVNKISETNRIIAQCMLKPFNSIQEQLDYAMNEAVKLTESQYGYICFYDENTEELSLSSWTKGTMDDCAVIDKPIKFKLEATGLWGEVIRQRKPIIINDFDAPNPLKRGRPDGHVRIHKFMSLPIFDDNKIVAVVACGNKRSDYTDNDVYTLAVLAGGVWLAAKRREKEKETELLLERTQSMFNNHEAAMLLIEPLSGGIIEANKSAESFYGYSKEELLGMKIQDINVLDRDESGEFLLKALERTQNYFTCPHRLKNGEIKTVDVYSSPIEYNGKRVLFSIIFDVTKREEVTKLNKYLAYHDYLTGVYNRRFFDDEFMRCSAEGGREHPIAILLGDVNGLKMFNDTFGHAEGDRALIRIADRMKMCIGVKDTLARVGGDEFAVIVTGAGEEEIKEYLDRLERCVNKAEGIKSLTISFGYGIQRNDEDALDELFKEAEAFMYNKKYYNSRSARSNTVNVIMDTLFTKSKREQEHCERVGLICEAIAAKMHLDKHLANEIRVAGFLHDIGKIGIDESIINKIGKLNKNEWEKMKLHCAKGAGILENTTEYRGIADFVLSHHEHYDGSGYPNGLKGTEIPLASRIIAVADSYDAMTNDRSYRKKMSRAEAINELKMNAGTFFDPEVVSAFIGEVLPEEA